MPFDVINTLSLLEKDHDVSVYEGGRRLLTRMQLVYFLTVQKGTPGLKCVSYSLDALSDAMVILWTRQSMLCCLLRTSLYLLCLTSRTTMSSASAPKNKHCKTPSGCINPGIQF